MDAEYVRLISHMDQLRSTVREAVLKMDGSDLIALFRDCMAGRLSDMDERAQLLVGCLAAIAIADARGRED